MDLTVDVLRNLFRYLAPFRALYEDGGPDILVAPGGEEWSLWDIEYLLGVVHHDLPPRQAQAIELFLVCNMREADVAEAMGVSRTNPIGMYATAGLERIIIWVNEGRLPRFRAGEGMNGQSLH